MRQLSISAAIVVLLTTGGEALAQCSTAVFLDVNSNSWFDDLNYCARHQYDHAPNTPYNATSLRACVAARPVSTSANHPYMNANLVSVLASATACPTCAVAYTNSVVDLYASNSDFLANCGATLASSAVWATTAAQDSFNSAKCVRYLYDDLTAFNTCSGLPEDLRTGAISTRCTYEEFYAWDTEYRPLGQYIMGTIDPQVQNHAPLDCSTCIGDFNVTVSIGLNVATDCGTSVADAYETVDETCLANPFLQAALDTMVVCTGGMAFRTGSEVLPHQDLDISANFEWAGEICVDIDLLYFSVYQPYGAFVECANQIEDINNTSLFDDCVGALMAIPPLAQFACGGCLTNMALEIKQDMVATCTSVGPFDPACVAALSGEWTATDNFYYCSGHIVDTVDVQGGVSISVAATQCVPEIITGLAPMYKTFVPILETVLNVTSISAAMTAITDSLSFLETAISGIACESCYNRLAADMFQLIGQNDLVASVCEPNPYSADCATALAPVLTTFEGCSGFFATSDSAYQCSSAEITALQADNMVKQIVQLGQESITSVQAVYELDRLFATLVTQFGPGFRCLHCFEVIVRALLVMTPDNLAACGADLSSIACEYAMGDELRAFNACSGFDFAVTPTTTASPTVSITTSTVAATTTVAAATSTAASTTTKSSGTLGAGLLATTMLFLAAI